jgi:hypothetical protein
VVRLRTKQMFAFSVFLIALQLLSHVTAYGAGLCDRKILGPGAPPYRATDLCDVQIALSKGNYAMVNYYTDPNAPVYMLTFSNATVSSQYGTWVDHGRYLQTVRAQGDPTALFTTEDTLLYGTIQALKYSGAHVLAMGKDLSTNAIAKLIDTKIGKAVVRSAEFGFSLTLASDLPYANATSRPSFVDISLINKIEVLATFDSLAKIYPTLYAEGALPFCTLATQGCPASFINVYQCLALMDSVRLYDIDGVLRTSGNSAVCRLYNFYYGNDPCASFTAADSGPCVDF